MIAIIDYGMGNLRSVQKGFEKLGFAAEVTADPRVLLVADTQVKHEISDGGYAARRKQCEAAARKLTAPVNSTL